jgi:hypothetical protein
MSPRRVLKESWPWLGAVLTVMVATPVWAAGDEPGRYTMSPTDGGVIRLDRQTGAMAFCTGSAGDWTCKDMPENESALKRRVEELEGEKRALEAEKQLRGAPPVPPGDESRSAEAVPAPPGDLPMPNEPDVDKLFDYVEGMVKKFKERIDRLEREAQKEPGTAL